MPISKKDRRNREQKAADAAGTRPATTKAGTLVKPVKEKISCKVCKAEIEKDKKNFLKDHADSKHPKNTYADCWGDA